MILVFSVTNNFIYVKIDDNKNINVSLGSLFNYKFFSTDYMLKRQEFPKQETLKLRELEAFIKKADNFDIAKKVLIKDLEMDGAKYIKDITDKQYEEIVKGGD